jgi:hypothetical protein
MAEHDNENVLQEGRTPTVKVAMPSDGGVKGPTPIPKVPPPKQSDPKK